MKSQGMPINFLVKFILSIVIFGLGVVFLWQIYDQGTGLVPDPSRSIQALNCRPTEPLCIGTTSLTLSPGNSVAVEVKLFNNRDDDIVYSQILFELTNATGDPVDDSILYINPRRLQEFRVPAKGVNEYGILIYPSRTTPLGDYSLQMSLIPQTPSNHPQLTRRINIFVR